jgi:hypothetical protein
LILTLGAAQFFGQSAKALTAGLVGKLVGINGGVRHAREQQAAQHPFN